MEREKWQFNKAAIGSATFVPDELVDRARRAVHQYSLKSRRRFTVQKAEGGAWVRRLADKPVGVERELLNLQVGEGLELSAKRFGSLAAARALARSLTARFRPARFVVVGGRMMRLAPLKRKKKRTAAPLPQASVDIFA